MGQGPVAERLADGPQTTPGGAEAFRHSIAWAALSSLSSALGVGLGVVVGAYLTVTSGAAAPGGSELGWTELAVLPGASAVAVFVILFAAKLVIRAVRHRSPRPSEAERAT